MSLDPNSRIIALDDHGVTLKVTPRDGDTEKSRTCRLWPATSKTASKQNACDCTTLALTLPLRGSLPPPAQSRGRVGVGEFQWHSQRRSAY